MIESSLVLYNDRLVSISKGTPSSVEFNFGEIWDYSKTITDFDADNFDFYHVHPIGINSYSETDLNCMIGYQIAFGKSVFFHIIIFENSDLNSLVHTRKTYVLKPDREVLDITDIIDDSLTDCSLALLKRLSYGDMK